MKSSRYGKYITTAFFISIFLLITPVVISDYFPAADNFFEKHAGSFYIFLLPIALYAISFVVLAFIGLAQFIFEQYHKDRKSGSSQERALLNILALVAVLVLIGFCSLGGRGIWID